MEFLFTSFNTTPCHSPRVIYTKCPIPVQRYIHRKKKGISQFYTELHLHRVSKFKPQRFNPYALLPTSTAPLANPFLIPSCLLTWPAAGSNCSHHVPHPYKLEPELFLSSANTTLAWMNLERLNF